MKNCKHARTKKTGYKRDIQCLSCKRIFRFLFPNIFAQRVRFTEGLPANYKQHI